MALYNVTHPSNLMMAIVSGTIGAAGVPGNVFLMALIASEYKKRKPYEWLLFTLTLGDFLLCLTNAALEAPFILNFERIECKIAGAFDYALGTASFVTPPLVAYNRYLSLYNNVKYKKLFTNRTVFVAYCTIMVFSFGWTVPFAITGNLGQDDFGVCGIQMRTALLKATLFSVVLVIIVLYIFLIYFSYKVVMKIRNHKKNAHGALDSQLIKESSEIITAMLVISIVPVMAQVPTALVKTLHTLVPPLEPWVTRSIMMTFPMTSALNAYVTIYIVKDYRKKALNCFRKMRKLTNVAPVATIQIKQLARN